MMDYSFIPQMYQQGLQHGLDKQFQLANSAQPVTQFLQSLRQAKQDQMAQQMEEDRQRRLDLQEAHQGAVDRMNLVGHFAREGTPSNVSSYRSMADALGDSGLIPPAKETVIPAQEVPAMNYGEDQGTAKLGSSDIPLTPKETPALSFSEIISRQEPTGSIWQQSKDKSDAVLAARREAQQLKAKIADDLNAYKERVQNWKENEDNPRNLKLSAEADKAREQIEEIQKKMDLGLIEATVGLRQAQAIAAAASAGLHSAQAAVVGQYTPAMAGRDASLMDRVLAGLDAKVALDPLGRKITPIQPRGAGSPAPAPVPGGKPLRQDVKDTLFKLQSSPTTKARGDAMAKELWDQGYRW